jgi:hypothetical protein
LYIFRRAPWNWWKRDTSSGTPLSDPQLQQTLGDVAIPEELGQFKLAQRGSARSRFHGSVHVGCQKRKVLAQI